MPITKAQSGFELYVDNMTHYVLICIWLLSTLYLLDASVFMYDWPSF